MYSILRQIALVLIAAMLLCIAGAAEDIANEQVDQPIGMDITTEDTMEGNAFASEAVDPFVDEAGPAELTDPKNAGGGVEFLAVNDEQVPALFDGESPEPACDVAPIADAVESPALEYEQPFAGDVEESVTPEGDKASAAEYEEALATDYFQAPAGLAEESISAETCVFDNMEAAVQPEYIADEAPVIPEVIRMGVGEKLILSGGNGYSSSKPKVAMVNAVGQIVAKRKGTAIITVTVDGSVIGTCSVTVTKAPKKITLPRKRIAAVGESITLNARVKGGASNTIKWRSNNPRVATVDGNGLVTSVGVGKAKIIARTYNGKKAACTVRVTGRKHRASIQSIAHRGGCGYWPENTLEAFCNAVTTGADGVEMDVRSTLDGVQVIHHDAGFDVGAMEYNISELTFEQLREMKPCVPTLDEALDVLGASGLDIFIEMKETADGAKCVNAVKMHGLEARTVYFSFYEVQLRQVYDADPTVTLGLSLKRRTKYHSASLRSKINKLHISFLVAHKSLLNRTVVHYWHGLGLKICAWTPNTRREVKRLCRLGIEYIMSDYPDYCVAYR